MTPSEINQIKIDLVSEGYEKIMGAIDNYPPHKDDNNTKWLCEEIEDTITKLVSDSFAAGYEAGKEAPIEINTQVNK